MEFSEFQENVNEAIDEEILAQKRQEGQKKSVINGEYLGKRNEEHIYSFDIEFEFKLPDDTPLLLYYDDNIEVTGLVVYSDKENLNIGLQEFIGDEIDYAQIKLTPWFLLEALKERIDDIALETVFYRQQALSILEKSQQGEEPDIDLAKLAINELEKLTGKLNYNIHQKRAIGHILNNRMSFIWGPPGTGKTHTLSITASALTYALGGKVLILSQNNVAVDVTLINISKMLKSTDLYKQGRILRYGVYYREEMKKYPYLNSREVIREQNPSLIEKIEKLEDAKKDLIKNLKKRNLNSDEKKRINEQIDQISKNLRELRSRLQVLEKQLLQKASLIGCTLSKAAISEIIHSRKFDAVLVDEVSTVYPPQCCFAGSLSKDKKAFFGDFRQLAPLENIAYHLKERSGNMAWRAAKWHSIHLIFFYAGLAATTRNENHLLFQLFDTKIVSPASSETEITIPEALLYVNSDLDRAYDNLIEQTNHKLPLRQHLFNQIQKGLQDIIYLGDRFEDVFYRFEIILALEYVNRRFDEIGDKIWGPVGLFGFKQYGYNPFNEFIKEGKQKKEDWELLQAGFFNSDYGRFHKICSSFQEIVHRFRW